MIVPPEPPKHKTSVVAIVALNTAGSYMLKEDILTLYSYSDQSVILNAVKDTIQ